MPEESSRAGSRRVTSRASGVSSRKKLEGLKLLQLQPQPSKSTERVRANPNKYTRNEAIIKKNTSEDKFTVRIEKRLSKKASEIDDPLPAENPEIEIKEPSENTVWNLEK